MTGTTPSPPSNNSSRCNTYFFTKPKLARLVENIGAAGIELTPDDLREIDGAASTWRREWDSNYGSTKPICKSLLSRE